MKRYIRSSATNRIQANLAEIEEMLGRLKYVVDDDEIRVAFSASDTPESLMDEGMIGRWFADRGYDVSFHRGDFEYTTKPDWINYRGSIRSKGHTAYLRNRLIMTIR